MSRTEQLWNDLTQVFRQVFNNSQLDLSESTTHDDIDGWTSLTHAMLIDALEKRFGVSFDFDEILSMQTVEDIFRTLEAKTNS